MVGVYTKCVSRNSMYSVHELKTSVKTYRYTLHEAQIELYRFVHHSALLKNRVSRYRTWSTLFLKIFFSIMTI